MTPSTSTEGNQAWRLGWGCSGETWFCAPPHPVGPRSVSDQPPSCLKCSVDVPPPLRPVQMKQSPRTCSLRPSSNAVWSLSLPGPPQMCWVAPIGCRSLCLPHTWQDAFCYPSRMGTGSAPPRPWLGPGIHRDGLGL